MFLRTLCAASVLAMTAAVPTGSALAAEDIFFSEYLEGTQAGGIFNLALEIYNPTDDVVDATQEEIRVEVHLDGSPTPSQTMIWGVGSTLAIDPGDVFVLAQVTADPALLALADDTVFLLWPMDGNDAIVLRRDGVIVDVIGQIGFDPGPGGWSGGGISTVDRTLRRKSTVCQGDPDGSDPFDPSVEWDGFPIDTFGGLGTHVAECGPTAVEATPWGRVKGRYR